jgi:mono/diheme cytochrome c family protein
MNLKNLTVIAYVAALPCLAGAAELDLTKLPAPAKKEGVTFTKDIKPLFDNSCVRCHGAERAKGDLRLTSLELVLKGGEHGKVVVAGSSEKSKLVHAVGRLNDDIAMPPKPDPRAASKKKQGPPPKPLTTDEVALVRAWIEQGAK